MVQQRQYMKAENRRFLQILGLLKMFTNECKCKSAHVKSVMQQTFASCKMWRPCRTGPQLHFFHCGEVFCLTQTSLHVVMQTVPNYPQKVLSNNKCFLVWSGGFICGKSHQCVYNYHSTLLWGRRAAGGKIRPAQYRSDFHFMRTLCAEVGETAPFVIGRWAFISIFIKIRILRTFENVFVFQPMQMAPRMWKNAQPFTSMLR